MKGLTIEQTFVEGFRVFRKAWLPLILLAAVQIVPTAIWPSMWKIPGKPDAVPQFGWKLITIGIATAAWTALFKVAMYRIATQSLESVKAKFIEVLGGILKSFLPITGTALLLSTPAAGFLLVPFAPWLMPLLAFLFLPYIIFLIWIGLGWGMVYPVMAREGLMLTQALKRSWKLIYGYKTERGTLSNWRRLLNLSLLLGILSILPRFLVSHFNGDSLWKGSGFASHPSVAGTITQELSTGVFSVLEVCVFLVFYYDLLARHEGFVAPWAKTEPSPTPAPPTQ